MDRLTPRERDIARLVAEGLTNETIGATLGIKHGTVKMNVINIFRKLGINKRSKLAVMFLQSEHGQQPASELQTNN